MNEIIRRLKVTPMRCLSGEGPLSRVVHSSRIRLARNLARLAFPVRSEAEGAHLQQAARQAAEAPLLRSLYALELDGLAEVERDFLMERHLISREFSRGRDRLLLLDGGENVAIMVNEEDHFRLQALRSGFDLVDAWRYLRAIEREFDARLDFAFDSAWGYLTACPTNLGTGLRVSALCHLPAIVMQNEMKAVADTAQQVGIAVRGFHGEGSQAIGNFFQFSNRATLGPTEEEIVMALEGWIKQVTERELGTRAWLVQHRRHELEDKVHRAWGLMAHARRISSGEMMNLLSLLRLGLDTGMITAPDVAAINSLQQDTQPAHLQLDHARALRPEDRDAARADYIRSVFAKLTPDG